MSALDRLEQEVYASMDDDANDVAELGDRLIFLVQSACLKKRRNKGSAQGRPQNLLQRRAQHHRLSTTTSINNSFTMGLTELFLAIGLLALAVAGIAIKILVNPTVNSAACSNAAGNEDGCSVQDRPQVEEPT